MSTSPSLRVSLRRKRSTRHEESSGSPAVKKNSPKLPEAKKEPPSTPKTHTSRRSNKLTRSASRTSPRLAKGRSADKSDNEEKNFQTPVNVKWTHGDSLRQPSPDMPFLSSQLCGTQECEVVWDCDSPGFSRDDLKRMHGGGEVEGPEGAVVIPTAPPRQLFPHTRTRLPRATSSGNTTAQLNDLLDLLSSKENAGRRKKENKENPYSLQQVVPPKDSYSEDSSSSESLVLPRPLREASSQPFEVPGVSGPKGSNQTSLPNDLDDSMWEDDLNLGLCDISDSVLEEGGGTRKLVSISKDKTDSSRLSSEQAELSSASADIFDDDLFSESVILSSQAVEEAMTAKNDKNVTNDRNYSGANYSKRLQSELKNVIVRVQENSKNINGVKNNSRSSNKSELTTHDILTTSKLCTNSRILPKVKVNQKNNSIDSPPPQRQVRRSFRFGPSPKDTVKSGPSAVLVKTELTLGSAPDTQKPVRTKETRCELKKKNLMPAFGTEKPGMQSTSASNLVYNKSKTSSVSSYPSAQGTKFPTVRKPLFRSSDTKAEEVKNRSNAQGIRGPLLRSQSISNARLTTSSPAPRRSNSSMELDTSQDLEDDEFFKSLLSMLPEEEGIFCDKRTLPVSPITSENKSWGSHSSNHLLGNARLHVGNKVTEVRGKSNCEKRHTGNTSLRNVSNGSVRTLSVGQVNLHPGVTNSKVDSQGKRPIANVQAVRPSVTNSSAAKTKSLDTRELRVGGSREQQTSDTFDDGLFEDDVLSLIDEVESQFGSQKAPSEPSPSPQSSQPQQIRCTLDEIARKKAAALQRREEKRRRQCR